MEIFLTNESRGDMLEILRIALVTLRLSGYKTRSKEARKKCKKIEQLYIQVVENRRGQILF